MTLRSEPSACRHLRAGELLRPLRPPAGACHEAPGGAGRPPRRDHSRALNTTAKPYFGDLKDMTYLEWAERFAELSFPWADWTYAERFLHLLQRIEARVCSQESGELDSLFADRAAVESRPAGRHRQAARRLSAGRRAEGDRRRRGLVPDPGARVPQADAVRASHRQRPAALVGPGSAVAVRGRPLLRRFRAHHPRPDLRGRHHHDGRGRSPTSSAASSTPPWSASREANNGETTEACRRAGRLRGRRGVHPPQLPEHLLGRPPDGQPPPTRTAQRRRELRDPPRRHSARTASCSIWTSIWTPTGTTIRTAAVSKHAVRDIVIPLVVNGAESGLFPVVDRDRLPEHVYAMLAATRRHRQHRHHRRRADRHAGHRGQRRQGRPSVRRGARHLHPVRQPRIRPRGRHPPAPCRRTSRPRASLPTRWSARPAWPAIYAAPRLRVRQRLPGHRRPAQRRAPRPPYRARGHRGGAARPHRRDHQHDQLGRGLLRVRLRPRGDHPCWTTPPPTATVLAHETERFAIRRPRLFRRAARRGPRLRRLT